MLVGKVRVMAHTLNSASPGTPTQASKHWQRSCASCLPRLGIFGRMHKLRTSTSAFREGSSPTIVSSHCNWTHYAKLSNWGRALSLPYTRRKRIGLHLIRTPAVVEVEVAKNAVQEGKRNPH